MRIFGKTLGEYVRFEAGLLILIAVVGIVRFGLYQAGIFPSGAPNAPPAARPDVVISCARWFSMNAVVIVGSIVLGYVTHRRGFGGYKHLPLLNLLPGIVSSWISAIGILTAIVFQTDTIYSLPDFSGHADGKTMTHVLAHVLGGPLVIMVAGTLVSAIVMLITRPRPKEEAALPVEPPAPAILEALVVPAPETPIVPSEPAPTVE